MKHELFYFSDQHPVPDTQHDPRQDPERSNPRTEPVQNRSEEHSLHDGERLDVAVREKREIHQADRQARKEGRVSQPVFQYFPSPPRDTRAVPGFSEIGGETI